MPFIAKFPLKFSADGRAEVSYDPRSQFDLYTSVEAYTLVQDPEYGMDVRLFLQESIHNIDEIMSMYLLLFRERVDRYFRDIEVSRARAEFDKPNRAVIVTIFVNREDGSEVTYSFRIKLNQEA